MTGGIDRGIKQTVDGEHRRWRRAVVIALVAVADAAVSLTS